MSEHSSHECSCFSHSSTTQTLDELDFERGIWSAALDGDIQALTKHIRNGHTNSRDNLGYTGKVFPCMSSKFVLKKKTLLYSILKSISLRGKSWPSRHL